MEILPLCSLLNKRQISPMHNPFSFVKLCIKLYNNLSTQTGNLKRTLEHIDKLSQHYVIFLSSLQCVAKL